MAASWRFTGIGQPEFTAPEVSQADEYTKTRESDLFRELLLSRIFLFMDFRGSFIKGMNGC